MKLIIDIPDYNLNDIQNGSIACGQVLKAVKNGKPYEEKSQGDLISHEALKKEMQKADIKANDYETLAKMYENCVDNAPTAEKPKSEYEFIEILAQYVPDDICTYPEYKGKPYYSIHYKQNGEEFVRYSTYNLEVLSGFLREYFMKGDKE